jgi:hypothetical protein
MSACFTQSIFSGPKSSIEFSMGYGPVWNGTRVAFKEAEVQGF